MRLKAPWLIGAATLFWMVLVPWGAALAPSAVARTKLRVNFMVVVMNVRLRITE